MALARLHAPQSEDMSHVPPTICRTIGFLFTVMLLAAPGRAAASDQSFTLDSTKDLTLINVKADVVNYKGRTAVRLTKNADKDGFALLQGTNFQDGTIDADFALKITTPPGIRMPGFVGIAFRARQDASRYELVYLRPGNANASDQAMRNHSVQYVSEPDFDWDKLRREWPWVYESHADLSLETWTHLRIEVKGRSAKLYLNGSEKPSLVVDGLKGEDLRGSVALWPYAGEEAYFSNVHIVNTEPLPLTNGGDPSGTWQVSVASDAGSFKALLQLQRTGNKVSGTWTGALGTGLPVNGTWRSGYMELSFDTTCPADPVRKAGSCEAILAGWVDGDAANGRFRVVDRADGTWTASRKP